MGLEQLLPWAVFLYLGGMSGAGLLAMGLDKRAARRNGARRAQGKGALRRIPERTLFLLAALGGSAGVWLGMYAFRHKTRHWYFVLGIPAILAAQLLLGWLLYTRLLS